MKVNTSRFCTLEVSADEVISFPDGVLGFTELKLYCLVDPGDNTLILWLQSLDKADVAFPILEPKIFMSNYVVKLSAQELKCLRLDNINQSILFNILTIPKDITQMTANLKAPIVINLRDHIGKQVVLQENEYILRYAMFPELKTQLVNKKEAKSTGATNNTARQAASLPINLRSMVPSSQIKLL